MSSLLNLKKYQMNGFLWAVFLLTTLFAGILIWTVVMIPRPLPDLSSAAAAALPLSGVDNSVTAVLLNFRGYDTMLEVMVFLLGAITVWSITHAPFPASVPETSPVQSTAVRILAPLICLIGFYLIWQGAYQTGGAFQGGAVFSAGLVLLLISDLVWIQRLHSMPLRLIMTGGPLVFVAMGLWGMLTEDALLKFKPEQAGSFLLFLELACGISIGLMLAVYFAGGRLPSDLREKPYTAGKDEGE